MRTWILVTAILTTLTGSTASAAEKKSPEKKAVEKKAADAKPAEQKAPEANPTEARPVAAKASESKVADVGALEQKPAPAAPSKEAESHFLYLGLQAGGLFSQPLNKLGASGLIGARAGYMLPFRPGQFVVALEGGYAAPGANGVQVDPRVVVNSGSYSWSLSERQSFLGLLFMHRATWLGTEKLTPFAGIGPRLWFLQSRVTGQAGTSSILLSTERSTEVGFLLPIGVEYKVGPGAITGEAQVSWAPIHHRITGDANVGALSLALGYRLLLL